MLAFLIKTFFYLLSSQRLCLAMLIYFIITYGNGCMFQFSSALSKETTGYYYHTCCCYPYYTSYYYSYCLSFSNTEFVVSYSNVSSCS